MGLQNVSHAMATELSAGRTETEHVELARRWPVWDVSLGYGFLMLLVGLTVIFIGKTLLHEQLMADIGTVIAFLGVGILGYRGLTLLMSKPAATRMPIDNDEPKTTLESQPTVRLPSAEHFEGVPSITDHTTRHLEPTPIERKTE
jgi:hypothetical protein